MTFNPMKVLDLQKHMSKKSYQDDPTKEYLVSTKYDGWYVYVIPNRKGIANFYSSSGRLIPSLASIDFNKLIIAKGNEQAVYIAEAFVPDAPFSETNGILNRKRDVENVCLSFHDLYLHEAPDLHYYNRYALLDHHLKKGVHKFKAANEKGVSNVVVEVIPNTSVKGIETVNSLYQEAISGENPQEGIIIRDPKGIYEEGKRRASLMKMKATITVDGILTRYYREPTEKGISFTVDFTHDQGQQKVVVNDHALQAEIEKYNSNLPAEVKCMSLFPNGSMRQPVLSRIRFDRL